MVIDGDALFRYIGACTRERRKALRLTQSEVADQLGLKRTSIANLEAGRQRLPLDLLYELCIVLDLDVVTILPSMQEVARSNDDKVVVSGLDGKLPPMTSLLVRALRGQLQEE